MCDQRERKQAGCFNAFYDLVSNVKHHHLYFILSIRNYSLSPVHIQKKRNLASPLEGKRYVKHSPPFGWKLFIFFLHGQYMHSSPRPPKVSAHLSISLKGWILSSRSGVDTAWKVTYHVPYSTGHTNQPWYTVGGDYTRVIKSHWSSQR